ncbi:MAG: glycosyltransferase family 2 protein [Nitrososphaerales archaeon]
MHTGVGLPKRCYSEPRECKAITFACALIKREVFDSGVWLDEGYYPILFEDVEFCFQALEKRMEDNVLPIFDCLSL